MSNKTAFEFNAFVKEHKAQLKEVKDMRCFTELTDALEFIMEDYCEIYKIRVEQKTEYVGNKFLEEYEKQLIKVAKKFNLATLIDALELILEDYCKRNNIVVKEKISNAQSQQLAKVTEHEQYDPTVDYSAKIIELLEKLLNDKELQEKINRGRRN